MVCCETGRELRMDDSECGVGSSTARTRGATLKIRDGDNLLQQLTMRLRRNRQLRTDELRVAQRSAQKSHALLLDAQRGIASPDDGVRVVHSGHSLQHLYTHRNDATTIPNLCLSVVDPDRRMGEECMLQKPIYRVDTGW